MKLVSLILIFGIVASATFYATPVKVVSINALSPRYNFWGWFPVAPEFLQYMVDLVRYVTLISHFYFMADADVFMFQEVSINAACLSNSSYIIEGGNWEPISGAMQSLGYQCHIAFHDSRHWWKYYDYDTCDKYNSYTPTGNGICVKTSSFSNIRFQSTLLNNGSSLAIAVVDYAQESNVTFISTHEDSDIQGQRVEEFDETFFELYPVSNPGIVVICGDYNTRKDFGSFRNRLARSGYTDPVEDLFRANGELERLVPSQALSTGWYANSQHASSSRHSGNIDFCLVKLGSAIADPVISVGDGSLYGYPNATRSGVIDFQLWTKYPSPDPNRYDTSEPYRTGEAMKAWGSDHFGYAATLRLRKNF